MGQIFAVCEWWEKTDEMSPFDGGVSSPVYRSMKTGDRKTLQQLPAGALLVVGRAADPEQYYSLGNDGLAVMCVLPRLDRWLIDSRASNCTKPEDGAHRCWVRHGTFGEKIHVDKVGNTCAAGAGSVFSHFKRPDQWHGYLHDGCLTT